MVEVLPLKDALDREFYAGLCATERRRVRTLRDKIQCMLFERTALSRKPAALAAQEVTALRDEQRLSPDLVFRDPYLLDFLGLQDTYSEGDLEAGILREMQRFLVPVLSNWAGERRLCSIEELCRAIVFKEGVGVR